MNTAQMLRDTFTEHEHLTPDADQTLSQIHERIDGRSAVTRLGPRRPFVVVATGVGVAATIVGIVAASVIIKSNDRPAGPARPASPSTAPSDTTSLGSHVGTATVASQDYVTLAATYLPTGAVTQTGRGNGSFGQVRGYCAFFADHDQARSAMWIDVEGATEQVLRGGTRTLAKVSVAIVEIEEHGYFVGQWLLPEVVSYFYDFGLVPVARDFQSRYQYNVVFIRKELLDSNEQVRWTLAKHLSAISVTGQAARSPEKAEPPAANRDLPRLRSISRRIVARTRPFPRSSSGT